MYNYRSIARKTLAFTVLGALLGGTSGCFIAGPAADEINPYGDGNAVQQQGSRDQTALTGVGGTGSKEAITARQALEVMGSYRKTLAPQPVYPLVQPAEVRMMWVPDHQDKHGNLVPANYYYLRVLNDRWAVQDAFELEYQYRANPGINYGVGPGGSSTTGAAPAAAPAGAPAGLPSGGPSTTYGAQGGQGSATPWVYKEQ